MSATVRSAFLAIALVGGLFAPSTVAAQGRSVDQLVRDINTTLTENSGDFRYSFAILPTGKLSAERRDNAGVVSRWEMYFEDAVGVSQTSTGQLFIECDESLGNCARETCMGVYESWVGCVRGSGDAESRLSDVLVIEYDYDTRALRSLQSAFEELLAHDLDAVSSFGNRSARQ